MKILSLVLVMLAALPAHAHKPSDGHLVLEGDGTGHVDLALRDLDAAIGLDANGDGAITWAETRAAAPRIGAYVRDRISITRDGEPCPLVLGDGALVDMSDGAYWSQPIATSCTGTLALHYACLFDLDAQHRGIIRANDQVTVVRDAQPVAVAIAPHASFIGGIWQAWTIFPVLFVLCLFARRTRLAEAIELVVAFAIAQSISLAIASAGTIRLPSAIIYVASGLVIAGGLVRLRAPKWSVATELGLLQGLVAATAATLAFDAGIAAGQLALVFVLGGIRCFV